jgi:hypothetical protein
VRSRSARESTGGPTSPVVPAGERKGGTDADVGRVLKLETGGHGCDEGFSRFVRDGIGRRRGAWVLWVEGGCRSVGRSRAVVAEVGCCCCGSGARCGWAGQPGAGFESPARARAPKPKPFGAAAAAAAALPPSESTLVQPTTSSNGSVIDTSHTPPPRPHDGLLPV